jgi:hypothetical protein
VPCCDIEHLYGLPWRGDLLRGNARRQGEHGSHVARELDPNAIVRRECVIRGLFIGVVAAGPRRVAR